MRARIVWIALACTLVGCGRIDYSVRTDASSDAVTGVDAAGLDGCAACPRLPPGAPCSDDVDCESGSCADGVCCDRDCDGDCASCATGRCMPDPTMCSGDCAACGASGEGYGCSADPAVCQALCSSAVCVAGATSFTCDVSSCCTTRDAPNFASACGMGGEALLGSGCRFEHDTNRCCTGASYEEVTWDIVECQAGAWVGVDSGADAFPCSGCSARSGESWSDTCGDASRASLTCP
jgi:hypothetical protein